MFNQRKIKELNDLVSALSNENKSIKKQFEDFRSSHYEQMDDSRVRYDKLKQKNLQLTGMSRFSIWLSGGKWVEIEAFTFYEDGNIFTFEGKDKSFIASYSDVKAIIKK